MFQWDQERLPKTRTTVLDRFVDIRAAWTRDEIDASIRMMLDARRDRLPSRDTDILIKPNLNNDLVAWTGNSTDLRVLAALFTSLRDFGFSRITVADGPNVGIERRGIDVFRRLRIDRLARRFSVDVFDLNSDVGERVPLADGSPRLARRVLEAGFFLSVPKIKTHAEARLSSACKSQVGLCVAQDKRLVHRDLLANIPRLVQARPPDLVLVDGIVAMEGNGPGDGDPRALGRLVLASDAWTSDLAVCRLTGLDWRQVPYLVTGAQEALFPPSLPEELSGIAVAGALRAPPPRSRLAILSEDRRLHWLKRLVRPIVSRPMIATAAYEAGIIQDVYGYEDDAITGVRRTRADCGACTACEDACPTGLRVAEIGVRTDPDACIACGYCHWACPDDVIALVGAPNSLSRQLDRYHDAVRRLRRP
jgi:uncharacterized protein (DUF362 family)/ferredoxin